MADNGRLGGKRAIVTGSDQGIGRAIVLRFAQEGARVAINYRHNEAGANEVKALIEGAGGTAIVVGADVSTAEGAQKLIGATIDAFGGLDVLVNNAGVEIQHPFLELSEQDWDTVIGVNLKGPFLCTQLAVRQMVSQGQGGRVVNISSVHEDLPMPGNSPYCAAKGGLRMLTRTLCNELGPHGITINNIGPGAVRHPDQQGHPGRPGEDGRAQRRDPARSDRPTRGDRRGRRLPRLRRGGLRHRRELLHRWRADEPRARSVANIDHNCCPSARLAAMLDQSGAMDTGLGHSRLSATRTDLTITDLTV